MSVLQRADREFDPITIDVYVHLRTDAGKGLGVHLFESLSYSPVVVGVAKNPFKVADHYATINRGRSKRPLFVSATGCSIAQAA